MFPLRLPFIHVSPEVSKWSELGEDVFYLHNAKHFLEEADPKYVLSKRDTKAINTLIANTKRELSERLHSIDILDIYVK